MRFLTVILLLSGLSFTSFAGNLPPHIDISYTVKTGIGHGELKETVEIIQDEDSHRYNISSEAQARGVMKIIKPGSILRNSRGVITAEGLQPIYFSDQRGKKKPSVAHFNWENNLITLVHEERKKQKTLPEDTLDRLSLSYNFMFSKLPEDHLDVHITDGRSLELTRYTIQKETLNTPIGTLETISLTRQPEHDEVKRKIWLAPDYYMLPVRIVSTEKDGLEIEKMVNEIAIKPIDRHSTR